MVLKIVLNIIAWPVWHMLVSAWAMRLSAEQFNPASKWYREQLWERGGRLYVEIFRIKGWKRKLPDGAALFKGAFRKKDLRSRDPAYLQRFLIETCRAELAHWVTLALFPVFFLFDPAGAAWTMTVYAFVANIPCIMAQRYNRIVMRRLLAMALRVVNSEGGRGTA